jgi:hypothetical protein
MDAGDEFVAVKRLGDVIVGTEAERADLRIHFADARQHHHRRGNARDAQLLQHVEPGHVGQVQVEQDDVVIIQLAQVQTFLAQVGRVTIKALVGEHQLDSLGRRRLVLDQQNAHLQPLVRWRQPPGQ